MKKFFLITLALGAASPALGLSEILIENKGKDAITVTVHNTNAKCPVPVKNVKIEAGESYKATPKCLLSDCIKVIEVNGNLKADITETEEFGKPLRTENFCDKAVITINANKKKIGIRETGIYFIQSGPIIRDLENF